MNLMKRILSVILLYTLLTIPSQVYGQKNVEIIDISAVIYDSLTISNQENLAEIYSMKVVQHFGREYLYTFSKDFNSFDIFDMLRRKYLYSVNLPIIPDLPDFKAVDFDVVSMDEIYLINSNGNLVLIDSVGTLVNTWEIAKHCKGEDYTISVSDHLNNFTVFQNKVYLPIIHKYKNIEKFSLKKKPAMLVYDLENSELEEGFGGFPKSTFKKGSLASHKYEFTTVKLKDQNRIIFSYLRDPEFNVYTTKKNKRVKRSKAASRFLADTDIRAQKDEFGNIIQYIKPNGFYHNVYWDPSSQVYYRAVAHHQDTQHINGSTSGAARRPFSIQVIDKKFNLISEIKVPETAPLEHMKMTMTKGGLLLQMVNRNDLKQVDFVLLDIVKYNNK